MTEQKCEVRDRSGNVYRFVRVGSSLKMIHPNGQEERVNTYGDAVWKLGDEANRSVPTGPDTFVRAWRKAVPAVFDWMEAG